MKLKELLEHLEGTDPEIEVVIRVAIPEPPEEYVDMSEADMCATDGDYLDITDERSITIEYGKLTIIGDKDWADD